jgi:dUTP pyrophosphatase
MIIEYSVREGALVPTRANPSDAGLDVYYCPTDPNVSATKIKPGENALLATGLSFGVPHGYMLQVCNRSSMGAKRSLVVGAHIVDSGYEGEVFIDLHNIGQEEQFVCRGDKVAQLVLMPVIHFRARQTEHTLYREEISFSNRQAGGLWQHGQSWYRTC